MSIDDLLSKPLPAVADDGFSARVMGRIKADYYRRMALISAGSAAAATIACIVLPMPALSDELGKIIVQIGTSPAMAIAAAALVLTALIDRRFVRI